MGLFSAWLRMLLLSTALFYGICSADVIAVDSVSEDAVAMATVDKDNNSKQLQLKDFPSTAGHRYKRLYTPSQVLNNNARSTESDLFMEFCNMAFSCGAFLNLRIFICLCRSPTSLFSHTQNSIKLPSYVNGDSTHDTSSGIHAQMCENYFSPYANCTRPPSSEEIDANTHLSTLCFTIQRYDQPKAITSLEDKCIFRDDITCCMHQLWASTQTSNDTYFTSPPSTRAATDTGSRSTTSNTIEETHSFPVRTPTPSSTSSNTTSSNGSDKNKTTYIIVGVTTSCAFILIIIVTVLLVIKLRRQSPETIISRASRVMNISAWIRGKMPGNVNRDSRSADRAMNISAWIRGKMPGNVNRDSRSADWFFRGKQQEQPTCESSVASVATRHNPAGISENSTCSDIDGSRRDENLYNIPNLTRQNTYTEYGNIAGIAGEYSSLDEASKYNHVYTGLSKMDPNSRPAMPLPPQANNRPTPYYSVARPHSNRPASQNTIDTNTILSEYETSQYVELLDENTVINQPINTNDYLVPLPYPPMVFDNTQPNSYITIIAGND